jgi:hypothetical protein
MRNTPPCRLLSIVVDLFVLTSNMVAGHVQTRTATMLAARVYCSGTSLIRNSALLGPYSRTLDPKP